MKKINVSAKHTVPACKTFSGVIFYIVQARLAVRAENYPQFPQNEPAPPSCFGQLPLSAHLCHTTHSIHRLSSTEMPPPRNLLDGSNLDKVFQETSDYVLGFTRIDVFQTVPGSQLRRAGFKGVEMWKEVMRENGFSNNFYTRVYVTDDFKGYATLVDASRKQCEEQIEQERTIPSCGLYLDVTLVDGAVLRIIDGRHRITALRALCEEVMKRCSCDKDDPRITSYRYVSAIIYSMDIAEEVTVLSKASNDSVTTSVPEDAHEKLTFIVALKHEYIAAEILRTGKKKPKVVSKALVRFYLGRCGEARPNQEQTSVCRRELPRAGV